MDKNERISLLREACKLGKIPDNVTEWLIENSFCTAPASARFHGSYEGGLFDHSYSVMNALVKLTADNGLVWQRKNSPYIVGLLHDVCKIDQYELTDTGDAERPFYRYVFDTQIRGHGSKSVAIVESLMELTDEETACILHHMGAYGSKDTERAFTNAVHAHSNVLWTHVADMLAAHVQGV